MQKSTIEIGNAVIGAIVGVVVGGPIGSIVGSVIPPALSLTSDFISRAITRKQHRLHNMVQDALIISGSSIDNMVEILASDDSKVDDFITLLKMASESDSSIDCLFKGLIGELINSRNNLNRERLLIIGDAVKNMRGTHIHVIESIYRAGGVLAASRISSSIGIPEMELRSVVRDLELRGIIKDLGVVPIQWKLRELGSALMSLLNERKGE